jgi:hypothetical protein
MVMIFTRPVFAAVMLFCACAAWGQADTLEEAMQQAQALAASSQGSAAGGTLSEQAGAVAGPITAFWTGLPSPDDVTLRWLASEVPDLSTGMVREIDLASGRAMLDSIIDGHTILLDFLTMSELRGPIVFYVPSELLASAWSKYDHLFLTPAYGKDVKGRPFRMAGLLFGNGRVEQIYDHEFTYTFNKQDYTVSRRMTARAEGPGVVGITGFSTHVLWFNPVIRRMTKVNQNLVHVETNKGDRDVPTGPIARRPQPLPLP